MNGMTVPYFAGGTTGTASALINMMSGMFTDDSGRGRSAQLMRRCQTHDTKDKQDIFKPK